MTIAYPRAMLILILLEDEAVLLVRALRAQGLPIGIVVLTARGTWQDRPLLSSRRLPRPGCWNWGRTACCRPVAMPLRCRNRMSHPRHRSVAVDKSVDKWCVSLLASCVKVV
jgi:hypothetical protein